MQITITVHCASFIATSCICNNFLESKYLSTATVAYLSREFLLFVKRIDHFFGGEILDFPHTRRRRTMYSVDDKSVASIISIISITAPNIARRMKNVPHVFDFLIFTTYTRAHSLHLCTEHPQDGVCVCARAYVRTNNIASAIESENAPNAENCCFPKPLCVMPMKIIYFHFCVSAFVPPVPSISIIFFSCERLCTENPMYT